MNPAFTKHAAIFDDIFSSKRANVNRIKNLANLLKIAGVKKLLDIGCGGGTITQLLANSGFDVTGLDASKEMILIAKEKYKHIPVKWLCQNFFKYKSDGFKFDGIIALYSFIQTLPTDYSRNCFFKLIKQHLTPSGYCFIEFQNEKGIKIKYPFNKSNSWVKDNYLIEAVSIPIDLKCYLLQFTIKDFKSKTIVAIFKHKIFYLNIKTLEKILHRHNMKVVQYVDASNFTAKIDLKYSLGIGCLFKCT